MSDLINTDGVSQSHQISHLNNSSMEQAQGSVEYTAQIENAAMPNAKMAERTGEALENGGAKSGIKLPEFLEKLINFFRKSDKNKVGNLFLDFLDNQVKILGKWDLCRKEHARKGKYLMDKGLRGFLHNSRSNVDKMAQSFHAMTEGMKETVRLIHDSNDKSSEFKAVADMAVKDMSKTAIKSFKELMNARFLTIIDYAEVDINTAKELRVKYFAEIADEFASIKKFAYDALWLDEGAGQLSAELDTGAAIFNAELDEKASRTGADVTESKSQALTGDCAEIRDGFKAIWDKFEVDCDNMFKAVENLNSQKSKFAAEGTF